MKKIVIAGGSGFLGSSLISYYKGTDNQLFILSRKHDLDYGNVHFLKWDGKSPGYWTSFLEDTDALINLCGHSVNCRYNNANREAIYDSRINSTAVLGRTIAACAKPPKVWINASSATFYHHSLNDDMDEETGQPGDGFSVDVCKKWEAVCNQFHLAETRRLILRLGIVLSHDSEAIKVLHQLARFGLGGKQGRGNQYFCWIHAIDFCKAIDRMIDDDQMNGVYNLCSPFPVTNCELMALIRKRF